MVRRSYTIPLVEVKRPAIPSCVKASATAALVFLMVGTTSAFLMPLANTLAISSRPSSIRPNIIKERGKKLMVSITEDSLPPQQDDPWVLLEDVKRWAILNRGEYDMNDFQNAINSLRGECQFNIHTIEKEIASIEQTLQQNECYQSQCTYSSDRPHSSQQQHVNDFNAEDSLPVPIPTLKAVFAGFKVTEYDRERLTSAHPDDHS